MNFLKQLSLFSLIFNLNLLFSTDKESFFTPTKFLIATSIVSAGVVVAKKRIFNFEMAKNIAKTAIAKFKERRDFSKKIISEIEQLKQDRILAQEQIAKEAQVNSLRDQESIKRHEQAFGFIKQMNTNSQKQNDAIASLSKKYFEIPESINQLTGKITELDKSLSIAQIDIQSLLSSVLDLNLKAEHTDKKIEGVQIDISDILQRLERIELTADKIETDSSFTANILRSVIKQQNGKLSSLGNKTPEKDKFLD